MSETPGRPANVPSGATWLDERGQWEDGPRDTQGERQGDFALYREDGTLYMRCRYEAGVQEGPFTIFHPNGAPAREGRFVRGEIDGVVQCYASDGPSPEGLRACCVPPGARRMEARYAGGELQREIFFDDAGRILLSDGTPRPERPPGLREDAAFEEHTRRWAVALPGATGAGTTYRYFTEAGRLDEDAVYADGRRVRTTLYGPDGRVRFEASFSEGEKRHGAWFRRFLADAESPYADPHVREERGAFEDDQPVGRWELADGDGALLRVLERGRAYDEASRPGMAVFRDETLPADEWRAMARSLRGAGLLREAICAAARALGSDSDGDVAGFEGFLAEVTAPIKPEEREALARKAADAEDSLPQALTALVLGGDPAALLRTIAAALPGAPRASTDLVEAAIRLAPDRPMVYVTRALVRIESGDRDGALADAARVEAASAETAAFVRAYAQVLFPSWGFAPRAAVPPAEVPEGMPDEPGQPLEAIQGGVALYVTRLARLRAALVERVGAEAPWLPPDLLPLLPAGPTALRRFEATITDETDEGTEEVAVSVDETIEPDGAAVPALLRAARASHAALAWLCWSAGEAEIAWPTRLAPPPNYGAAVAQALHRAFRAHDLLVTNGLRSMTAGVPGFLWEGQEVDELPRPSAEILVEECLEVRALFLWLSSPENLSPFQSDLRQL